jgi:N-sulfoglucosamine sulfohydrolase
MKHDWAQYYDRIQEMDEQAGKILKELDNAGLAENTIVFYYSDHGGALGRSKRFMYESGLHVPLIIRFPAKYAHLAPGKPGSSVDRIVTFVDFAPTILSLAGIGPPAYYQGNAFLGKTQGEPRDYAYAFRGRMDERFDMVRSVRDKKYRYIKNYMPHKIYGQYLNYLWKAPSMGSWEKAWISGKLNEAQSAFWKPKPSEELYDVASDPHNIRNLAVETSHKDVLYRMREANRQWMLNEKDIGFIPEPMMLEIAKNESVFEYARSGKYPLEKIMETAELASSKDPSVSRQLKERLRDENAVVRYWAAIGCVILAKDALSAKQELVALLNDPEISVRIVAAEALYQMSEKEKALATLKNALQSDNLMARVLALNVLDTMDDDASSALPEIQQLLTKNIKDGDYDVRAATRIIEKLK